MTRKDYEAIAQVMNDQIWSDSPFENNRYDTGRALQWEVTCKALADCFKRDNPRFDRTKFLEACGME